MEYIFIAKYFSFPRDPRAEDFWKIRILRSFNCEKIGKDHLDASKLLSQRMQVKSVETRQWLFFGNFSNRETFFGHPVCRGQVTKIKTHKSNSNEMSK